MTSNLNYNIIICIMHWQGTLFTLYTRYIKEIVFMQELETRIMDIDVDNIRNILLANEATKFKIEDFYLKRGMLV